MIKFIQSDSRAKALFLAGATAFALAACGGDKTSPASSNPDARSSYELPDDHAIGNVNAKATIVEHASVVCGACANWHNTVYPDLKKKYIDSGLVRFVFREFPTSPETLAQAGFLIANCAGEDRFFDNISLQFKRQPQIFDAARKGSVKDEYIAIAKAGGLSEADFEACLVNEEEIARYETIVKHGIDAGVTGTPTFFINGEKEDRTDSGMKVFTLESFDEILRPILGEDAPASEAPKDEQVPKDTEAAE